MTSQKFIAACLAISFGLFISTDLLAQGNASESKSTIPDDWMENFSWRSIGPANMSGRILI